MRAVGLSLHLTLMFLLNCFIPTSQFAQNPEYFNSLYDKAKQLFLKQQYDLASESFIPLISENKNNRNVKNSLFFYSLSCFNAKRFDDAKEKLVYLQQKFDAFKTDEVAYLLANVYFELKEFDKAFKQLSFIKNPELLNKSQSMKTFYIDKFKDPKFLKSLFDRNSTDIIVAKKLYNLCLLSEQKEFKELALKLEKKFRFENNLTHFLRNPSDTLRIAILFPFKLMEINQKSGNQDLKFLSDYWAGILMASDSLNLLGINHVFYPIDVDKDTSKMLDFSNSKIVSQLDFSIGPVFSNLSELTNLVSRNTKHIFLLPFLNNAREIDQNAKLIFVQPQLKTIAENAAEKALEDGQRRFSVFYSNNPKDSLSALSCKLKLEALGAKVIEFKKVDKNVASVFSKSVQKKNLDDLDAIFLFTSEQMIATQYLTSLALANAKINTYVP
ncbi:MAG: hypothetical protein SNJ77_04390, partial [Cytophagales bacterium]